MKRIYKSEQSGRSMVEMLGVLAIIGVLSVAGIAGYSKAMAKFKVSKTLDQVAMLVANIRTIYAGQRDYAGLSNQVAIRLGLIPTDMISTVADAIVNAFQGNVWVTPATTGTIANSGFAVKYNGLSREACASLATSDWGSGSNTGLVAMSVAASAVNAAPAAIPGGATLAADLPISPATAAGLCNQDASQIIWYYY